MHPGLPLSGPVSREYLWYIPNTVLSGHRGDDTVDGWGSLEYSVELAQRAERNGWGGALIGAGWGRGGLVHDRDRDRRPDHDVRAAGRDSAGLLASRTFRQRCHHP